MWQMSHTFLNDWSSDSKGLEMNQQFAVSSSFAVETMPTQAFAGLALTTEQGVQLRIMVAEFRAAQSRVASELVVMCSRLAVMKDILGDKFQAFVEDQLKLNWRTAKRYLDAHSVMQKHLQTDGRLNVAEASMFTQGALKLLSPVTDEDVIDEVRAMAQSGTKIDEAAVKLVVQSRDVDFQQRIELAESEATRANNQLDVERQQRQIEAAQSQLQVTRMNEIIRRTQEQAAALEEDVQRLTKQNTVVTEVEKPIVPPGYTSAEEAIGAAQAQLATLRAEITTAIAERDAQERIASDSQTQFHNLVQQHSDFLSVKDKVDEILKLLPESHLQTLNVTDPGVKKAINAMGTTLVAFGKHLQAVAVAAA